MARSGKHLLQQDALLHPLAAQEVQEGASQTGYANLFATVPAQKGLVLIGSQAGTRMIKE
jgi:hypothetical protein